MRKRARGLSMVEVMVASSLFVVVMMLGAGAVGVVKRSRDHLKGRSEPRQQLRTLLGHLQNDVRAACFIYDPHLTVNFGANFSHAFDGAPPTDPNADPNHDAIFALVESADSSPSYSVYGIFLQPDTALAAAYPDSHHVVLASVAGMNGPTPGSPADIPLGALPAASAQARTFATASPADGLRIRRNPTGDALSFEFQIGHRTEGEKVVIETYQTRLTLRNNR